MAEPTASTSHVEAPASVEQTRREMFLNEQKYACDSIRDHQRYRMLTLGAFVGAGSGIALQQIEFYNDGKYVAVAVICFLMAFLSLVIYFTVRIIEFNVEVCRVFLEKAEEQIKSDLEPQPGFATWYEAVSQNSRILKNRLSAEASRRARGIDVFIAVIIFGFSAANVFTGLAMLQLIPSFGS